MLNIRNNAAALIFLAILISSNARAIDVHPGGERAQRIEKIADRYEKVSPFDIDRNGLLDAAEQNLLAEAIDKGALSRPVFRGPPRWMRSGTGTMTTRFRSLYERLARFDANRDGRLDDTEFEALESEFSR